MEKESNTSLLGDSTEVDIDPKITTLEDLLIMANESKAGTILIKGEAVDGKAQWGLVITCCEESESMMESLESAMETTISKWLLARSN